MPSPGRPERGGFFFVRAKPPIMQIHADEERREESKEIKKKTSPDFIIVPFSLARSRPDPSGSPVGSALSGLRVTPLRVSQILA
jgi:hypothetical protein